jgi:hypothetical protein
LLFFTKLTDFDTPQSTRGKREADDPGGDLWQRIGKCPRVEESNVINVHESIKLKKHAE